MSEQVKMIYVMMYITLSACPCVRLSVGYNADLSLNLITVGNLVYITMKLYIFSSK